MSPYQEASVWAVSLHSINSEKDLFLLNIADIELNPKIASRLFSGNFHIP